MIHGIWLRLGQLRNEQKEITRKWNSSGRVQPTVIPIPKSEIKMAGYVFFWTLFS